MDLPSSLFNNNDFEQRISTKVKFDTINETLLEVETIDIEDDGRKVTTTSNPVYEDVDGEPVKIGMITQLDVVFTELVDGFNEDFEYIESEDDLPELSEEDFNAMESTGAIHEVSHQLFSNPADLSYTETQVELYTSVDINNVDDAEFKLLFTEE